jgi:glucan endo-1,3-alpha-glucosidase
MTIEICAVFCNMGMYSIAGVEYGNECFCGNTLLTDGSTYGVGNQTGCTFTCAGNNSEICGGSNFVSVYSISPFMPTKNVMMDTTPFTAANANGGCASDYAPGNDNVRTLSATSTSSSNMTQEVCSSFCSGYTYYGVEYSTQCYCGNTIDSSSIVAINCTDTCGGNSAESCGGGWAVNIFTNTV